MATESASENNIERFLDNNYKTCGNVQTLPDGLQFYEAGQPSCGKSVVLIPDLFGWNSGRVRNLADFLGCNGYYTLVPRLLTPTSGKASKESAEAPDEEEEGFPNLFDFSRLGEYMKSWAYDSTLKPKIACLVQHLESVGAANRISILSFSWGSWVSAHVLVDPDLANKFCCAVMAHPSITLEDHIFGGSSSELMDAVQKPLLLIPCQNDPNEYREGGAFFESLKSRLNTSEVMDLPTIEHGFLPRGNIRRKEIYDAVKVTMEKTLDFFSKQCV